MKKILFLGTLLLLSGACSPAYWAQTGRCAGQYETHLIVSTTSVCAEVVSTPEQMAKGLSGKEKLTEKQGMLFDFLRGPSTGSEQNAGMPAFWMKDMKFDIDIIWIKDSKIIAITKNVPAPRNADENQNDRLPNYSPPSPVDHVLEVNAGWSERHGVKEGDEIKF